MRILTQCVSLWFVKTLEREGESSRRSPLNPAYSLNIKILTKALICGTLKKSLLVMSLWTQPAHEIQGIWLKLWVVKAFKGKKSSSWQTVSGLSLSSSRCARVMLSWVCISQCTSSISVLSLFVCLCLPVCLRALFWSSIEICIPFRRARLLDVFYCPPNAERRWFLVSPRLACSVCGGIWHMFYNYI